MIKNQQPVIANERKLAIVVSSLDDGDNQTGKIYSGTKGFLLAQILQEVGLSRLNCFMGYTDSLTLEADLEVYCPKLIIAVGGAALEKLTGKKGIDKWRSSILIYKQSLVLPILDMPSIFMDYKWKAVTVADLRKVAVVLAPEWSHPSRTMYYNYSFEGVIQFLTNIIKQKQKVAFDIETDRGTKITCIGFATSPTFAVTIPFDGRWSEIELTTVWSLIKQLLEDKNVPKIAQNAQFDMGFLALYHGIVTNGLTMCTMIASHDCYPELPKSLAFLTSLYTLWPYYKDEGSFTEGDSEQEWKGVKDWDQFYMYNAKDCCVTYEVSEKLEKEELDAMQARGGFNIDMACVDIALYMMIRGIKIDCVKCLQMRKELSEQIEKLDILIEKMFGMKINTKSPKQMKELLYDKLKLPPVIVAGKVTTNADALIVLARKGYKDEIMLLLKNRQLRTREAFYHPDVHTDGRLHASFNIAGTETGRWSSTSSLLGGRNIMNIPKEDRIIYAADKNKILIGFDKAQAEARVVAYKAFVNTKNETYKKIIESGDKIHVWFGCKLIENKTFPISKDEFLARNTEAAEMYYYISKVGIHAFSYGMMPLRFTKILAKETDGLIIISSKLAQNIKDALYSLISAIPDWQRSVEGYLRTNRILINSFGRSRFFMERMGESLFGEAYAFEPQSTVADDIATSMIRIYQDFPDVEILQQNYDSVLMQCAEGKEFEIIKRLHPYVTQTIKIESFNKKVSHEFKVPVVFSYGKNWKEMTEIK